eukprot:40562-Rhodomonas_salina.2
MGAPTAPNSTITIGTSLYRGQTQLPALLLGNLEAHSTPPQQDTESFSNHGPQKEEGKVIEKGLQKLKDEGSKWAGMMYQTDMVRPLRSNVYISLPPLRLEVNWPEDQQTWTLYDRASGFHVKPQPGDASAYP